MPVLSKRRRYYIPTYFQGPGKKGRNVLSRIPFECITGAHKKPYIQTQSQIHIYNALKNEDRI